jgi:hypothetical protein
MTDWQRILTQHGIPFADKGRNLYVKCVFCGTADEGQHLGISTTGRGWGCWRNAKHRGKSEVRLLAALLRVDPLRAAALLGRPAGGPVADLDLGGSVRRLLADAPPEAAGEALSLPPEIKPLSGSRTWERGIFLDYLKDRGYQPKDVWLLCEEFHLHYAMTGPFAYRLVLPVYDETGLKTWTGRTVSQNTQPRYLTLSTHADSKLAEEGMPLARAPITDMLFQEDHLFSVPQQTLVVCEGPFDAMRVAFAHRRRSVSATCLFGKVLSDVQFDKLAQLAQYSDHKFLLLDSDARLSAFGLNDRLSSLGFHAIHLPGEYKDPGDERLGFADLRDLIEAEIEKHQGRTI